MKGGVFDGRYIYFESLFDSVVRFDTRGSFTEAASWATFDTPVGSGPGAFDGRYVYLPGARYDTQGSFTAAASWSFFVQTEVGAAVFDGRYLYFDSFMRFDAKTPPALPAGPAHGSFF